MALYQNERSTIIRKGENEMSKNTTLQTKLTQWDEFKRSPQFENDKKGMAASAKNFIINLIRFIIIIGICYVILSPVIGTVSSSFFSDSDAYNPMVYTIPSSPTIERYQRAAARMNYIPTITKTIIYTISLMAIQIVVCSMVGYGFARFDFPLKKVLFGCVVIMIVIPTHTIMLPLYMTFRNFDPLVLGTLINGSPINLMSSPWPMYVMTVL